MTSPRRTDLDALQRLLRAAGMPGRPIHADVETVEYDWQVPSHFSGEHLAKIDRLCGAVARCVSEALKGCLRQEVTIAPEPVAQYYRHDLTEPMAGEADFRVLLGPEQTPGAMMVLSGELAVGWVSRLLGGSSADPAKELSELESDLLADTVAVVAEAISQAFREAGGTGLSVMGTISREQADLPGDEDAEYCGLFFKTDPSQEQADIRVAVLSDLLDPAAGPAESGHAKQSPEESRTMMTEHFARVPVTADAMVGSARLTVREVTDIQAGDVILLPKGPGDPVWLYVDRAAVSAGRAVVSSGRCAVQVLENFAASTRAQATRQRQAAAE